MGNFKSIGNVFAVVMVLAGVTACGQASPTAPGGLSAPTVNEVEAGGVKLTALAASSADGFLRVRNDGGGAILVGMAVYQGGRLFAFNDQLAQPGATQDVHVPVPACGAYTVEAFHTVTPDGDRPTTPPYRIDISRFTSSDAVSTDWCR